MSDFWPLELRRQREIEHADEIRALPPWTLFRAGWLTSSGHVQGGIYYRTPSGCGPTGRDLDSLSVLRDAARDTVYTNQPWAIQVLAEPRTSGCPDQPAQVTDVGSRDGEP